MSIKGFQIDGTTQIYDYNSLDNKPTIPSGADGYSPTVSVEEITGGHRVTITDKEGEHVFDVLDGTDGSPGAPGTPGADGYSPTVTVTDITGGHRVTITDANGAHTFDVMDGEDGSGGSSITVDTALSGSSTNPVQNKVVKAALDEKGTYTKPSTGIPKSDLAAAVQTSLDNADTALQSVPSTYRTAAAQDAIDSAQDAAIAAKYTKPSAGIPASDLAAGVIPTVPTNVSAFSNDAGYLTLATLPIYNGGVT